MNQNKVAGNLGGQKLGTLNLAVSLLTTFHKCFGIKFGGSEKDHQMQTTKFNSHQMFWLLYMYLSWNSS